MASIRDILYASEVTLHCPTCAATARLTLGELKSRSHFTCGVCASVVPVDFTDFEEHLAELQRALDEATARLDR